MKHWACLVSAAQQGKLVRLRLSREYAQGTCEPHDREWFLILTSTLQKSRTLKVSLSHVYPGIVERHQSSDK